MEAILPNVSYRLIHEGMMFLAPWLKGCLMPVQIPAQNRDQEIVNAAKNIMFSSAQKLQLTELSGRRDMSLLLAQSAVQVCTFSAIRRLAMSYALSHQPHAIYPSAIWPSATCLTISTDCLPISCPSAACAACNKCMRSSACTSHVGNAGHHTSFIQASMPLLKQLWGTAASVT